MKYILSTSIMAVLVITGLTSVQTSPRKVVEAEKVANVTLADSVTTWEVRRLIESELSARLIGQGGITSSWAHMDKSGHRDLVVNNVDYNFKNVNNHFIQLTENNEVYGDLVRLDGTLRSHICSFKIVYPEKKVFARKSALDEWQDVETFTGVTEKPVMRDGGINFDEELKKAKEKEKKKARPDAKKY